MENKESENLEKTTPEEAPSEPKAIKKDPFALIGKIAVILLIAAILVVGGYLLAIKFGKKDSSMQKETSEKSVNIPTVSATPEATATPTIISKKTVKAGLSDNSTSFKPYSISVPVGWTDSRDKTDITDKLTITKGAYSVSIYQAPMGGGACLYPGDAPSEMAQSFTDFIGITGLTAQYRRSWNKVGNPAGTIGYTVCQKSTTENSFGSPTSFGAISIKTPDPADAAILSEIDGMISSLTQ